MSCCYFFQTNMKNIVLFHCYLQCNIKKVSQYWNGEQAVTISSINSQNIANRNKFLMSALVASHTAVVILLKIASVWS